MWGGCHSLLPRASPADTMATPNKKPSMGVPFFCCRIVCIHVSPLLAGFLRRFSHVIGSSDPVSRPGQLKGLQRWALTQPEQPEREKGTSKASGQWPGGERTTPGQCHCSPQSRWPNMTTMWRGLCPWCCGAVLRMDQGQDTKDHPC